MLPSENGWPAGAVTQSLLSFRRRGGGYRERKFELVFSSLWMSLFVPPFCFVFDPGSRVWFPSLNLHHMPSPTQTMTRIGSLWPLFPFAGWLTSEKKINVVWVNFESVLGQKHLRPPRCSLRRRLPFIIHGDDVKGNSHMCDRASSVLQRTNTSLIPSS